MNIKYTITTERLTIEPITTNESSFIVALLNTEGWLKFIGSRNVHNEEEALAYIGRINNSQNLTYWTVKLKNTSTSIGIVTLIQRDYLEHLDIGFAFLPAFEGKGFAYEATEAVLETLRKNKVINKILAVSVPENKKSIQLLEKLGLHFEKTIVVDEEELNIYAS
jgi:[ribosomal protein S5]-alanine N-acetyltransferase